jgi:hypothetical protein
MAARHQVLHPDTAAGQAAVSSKESLEWEKVAQRPFDPTQDLGFVHRSRGNGAQCTDPGFQIQARRVCRDTGRLALFRIARSRISQSLPRFSHLPPLRRYISS